MIPSAGAKPDDAIFAYWTDLDFSKGGEVYISTNEEEQTSTITWLDAPYYCHGAGEGEWSSEPDYGPAWHVSCYFLALDSAVSRLPRKCSPF